MMPLRSGAAAMIGIKYFVLILSAPGPNRLGHIRQFSPPLFGTPEHTVKT
jgi:hypothetical protein